MPKRSKRARSSIANLGVQAQKKQARSQANSATRKGTGGCERSTATTSESDTSSSSQIEQAYPIPNSTLIKDLNLRKHPEGGYFVETDRQSDEIPSPFADGALRSLATTIYYLLTPDQPNGVFHMNKSATMHVLHQGRAQYTLITPGNPPRLEHKVMGSNISAGEVLQLLVSSGVWKMSRLLPEDVSSADADPERVGCLITEVVFPGFAWEDHGFLTREDLAKLYSGAPGGEEWAAYVKDVQK